MTAEEIVRLILSLPGVGESAHFGNRDVRVASTIFATHPKPGQFNLNLTPEQQALLPQAEGQAFTALPNKWGQKGWTAASVAALDEVTALSALRMAWTNAAPRALADNVDWAR